MKNQKDGQKKSSISPKIELMVLEEPIDFQTQIDYLEYSHSFDMGELTEEQTIHLGGLLSGNEMPVEHKKKALAILAHLGTLTALREIEKFYPQADKELKSWSALALQECKMFLGGELADMETCFISSGLGGLKNRSRYYFFVIPLEGKLFTITQKNVIRDEVNLVAKELRSLVESFDLSDTYVGFKTLMPPDIAVATLMETAIKKCNELGEFVFEYYYATNADIPNEAEIEDIIQIIRSD